jgi:hypothetical protein
MASSAAVADAPILHRSLSHPIARARATAFRGHRTLARAIALSSHRIQRTRRRTIVTRYIVLVLLERRDFEEMVSLAGSIALDGQPTDGMSGLGHEVRLRV